MLSSSLKLSALLAAAFFLAPVAMLAQDNGALLDALVKKGILTDQEAEDLRVDLVRDSQKALTETIAIGKATTALSIGGRLQAQFDGLNTSTKNAADPASVNHFFLRRVYLTVNAKLGADWESMLTYDFAGSSFDKALVRWNADFAPLTIDGGLRKVNFAYEETTSSGSLKAIERSGATRYFTESNNGRRLAGGSYRIGVFTDYNGDAMFGKKEGVFAGAAVTNPELVSSVSSIGDSTMNGCPAFWANTGYSGKISDLPYVIGLGGGYLPGRGGLTGNGADDMFVGSIYASTTIGKLNLAAEFLIGQVQNGLGNGTDATPFGAWAQASYMLTEKLEAVARYSYLDSDGRGVRVSDGIRNAPSAGNGNVLHDYFVGLNYYFLGNDLKVQLGYVGGFTTGGTRNETTNGVRTQIQVNF